MIVAMMTQRKRQTERAGKPHMIDKDLQERFQFFAAHAGGVVGENAKTALDLARAEQWMEENGIEYSIETDYDCDLSWMSEREREQEHEVVGVCLRLPVVGVDIDGSYLPFSIWGVVDATQGYLRVLVAELAFEAQHDALLMERAVAD